MTLTHDSHEYCHCHMFIHKCWCCSARACRDWCEEKEHSREGRHTTSLLLARSTLQHITNKHTLDGGLWSMGLEVGLHTCIRHTFSAPISSRYSNHKMCPLHTFHLCIQRYKGHNLSSDIGIGSRGGRAPGARALP